MKIFLSWSGNRSRAVAEALNDWLRRVIQAVKPFYSPEIEKGAKWSSELDDALEGTRFGIICLTPTNIKSVWIHYEAGALSKTKDALIWTFLHGLTPGDVPPPLGKFQHTVAEKKDVLRLLKTINGRLGEVGGEPLQDRLLEENFEIFWPLLEKKLIEAEQIIDLMQNNDSSSNGNKIRDERAILDEILELVRSQERRLIGVEERIPIQAGQEAIRQAVRHPNKLYSTLYIPISSSTPNAESIAEQLGDIFSNLVPSSRVVIETKPDELIVNTRFDPPIQEVVANHLVEVAILETGHVIKRWGMISSDA
jgi:hypothetical protein